MATTIALSRETHYWLHEYKEKGGLASMDEAVALLLRGGAESATVLFARNEKTVRAVCRRHGLTEVTAFGSRAWGSAHPNSDLDLVAHVPAQVSLLGLIDIETELSKAFGVKVDLHTWSGLRPRVRERAKARGLLLLA